MKKVILMLVGLVAAGQMAMGAEARVVALATSGDVDGELVARVAEYVRTHAQVTLRPTDPVVAEAGEDLNVIGRRAAGALKEDELGVLVLGQFGEDQPQGICLPPERFGILNLSRHAAGEVEMDRLARRAGQDSLRVMALLVGMSPCPFPLCVLAGFEKTEDLDRMSGNYCPPCQDRFARLAREAGLELTPTAAADEDGAGETPAVE